MAAETCNVPIMRSRNVMLIALSVSFCAPLMTSAANASEPHPHQGEIPRLKMDGKPVVKLSEKDLEQIEAGHLWMKSQEVNGVGTGIGIRDIAAPASVVFRQISDLAGYVGKVPMLSSLKVYSSTKKGGEVVEKATYKVRVIPGYYYEYYVEHHASEKKGMLLFYLDYGRLSDFNDLQGKWYLEKHPSKPDWTRVYYQCDLKLFGYAPAMVKTLLTSKGLESAIGWVKRESEKVASKQLAAAFVNGVQLAPFRARMTPVAASSDNSMRNDLVAQSTTWIHSQGAQNMMCAFLATLSATLAASHRRRNSAA